MSISFKSGLSLNSRSHIKTTSLHEFSIMIMKWWKINELSFMNAYNPELDPGKVL